MSYSTEDIERGLTTLALQDGNSRQASRELARLGEPIPASTLTSWKNRTHAERYEEIKSDIVPKIQSKLAGQFEQLAERGVEALGKAIDKASAGDYKDSATAAGAAQKLAVATGITVDKGRLLRGDPTEIRENRSAREIWSALHTMAPSVFGPPPEIPETTAIEVSED